MKKLLLILLAFTILSCGDDCEEQAQIQYIGQRTTDSTKSEMVTIISEDTCFEEDTVFSSSLRINNGVKVTFKKKLTIQGSNLLILGNAEVRVLDEIPFVKTIFFVNDGGGLLHVANSIFVSNDTNANTGASGTVIYGTTMVNQITNGDVTIIQDATPINDVVCGTLTNGGLDSSLGGFINVPCGYDYSGQKVKTDDNGNAYIYIKLD